MTRPPGRRTAPETDNSSLILGILIGMVLGLIIAGAVAWHLSKRPNPFNNKNEASAVQDSSSTSASHSDTTGSAATPPVSQTGAKGGAKSNPPASGNKGNKEQYEFYKILTTEKDTNATAAHTPPQNTTSPAKNDGTLFLQAGSFNNEAEAENLKGKLAFQGLEANVKHAEVAGKLRYRVFVGPFHSTDEINKANTVLKQNGIKDAYTVRAVTN